MANHARTMGCLERSSLVERLSRCEPVTVGSGVRACMVEVWSGMVNVEVEVHVWTGGLEGCACRRVQCVE